MTQQITNEKELKESYEKIWKNCDLREERNYYSWILDLLHVDKNQKLLDVACGAGYLLNEASIKKSECYGIDISRNAINRAKNLNNNPEFILASSETIPFYNNVFDHITCLGSLEHFLSPETSLDEMGRVLKDSGKICIVLPNLWCIPDVLRGWFIGEGLSHGQESERFYSLKEAKILIEKYSVFKINQIMKYNQSYETIKNAKPLPIFNNLYLLLYKLFKNKIPITGCYVFVFICTKRCLDAPSTINVGTKEHEKFLSWDWYHIENWPPSIRWTGKKACVYLKANKTSSTLIIKAITSKPDINVNIFMNKKIVEKYSFINIEWNLIKIKLPKSDTNIIELIIEVDKTWIPDNIMKNGDLRELGIAVEKIWIE